jgi:hypothetical protein
VRPRFRYPAFKQVMWYAADAFAKRLQRLAGLSGATLQEQVAAQLAVMAKEDAAAAAAGGSGGAQQGGGGSASMAGAAQQGEGGQEVADDAATQQAQRGGGPSGAAAAGQRSLQLPAAAARPRPAGATAAGPRQVGRAVGGGGGGRLQRMGGSVGGGGAVARAPVRLNPTQPSADLRGGGGGGGGGGQRRKRQRSPDSFIDQDSADEVSWRSGHTQWRWGGCPPAAHCFGQPCPPGDPLPALPKQLKMQPTRVPPSGPGCRPAAVAAAAATMTQMPRGRSGPQRQRGRLPAMMTRRCLMLQRMAWTSGALQRQVKTSAHC